MYSLDRIAGNIKTRIAGDPNRREIGRLHLRALLREVDDLVYRDLVEVRVRVTEFCSEISDDLSGRRLVSFFVSGPAVYDTDIDDTDSLDVTTLRRRISRGEI